MKDIPMFTTEYGFASLVLREVPYLNAAYVRILSAEDPQGLLQECVGFCRGAGAQEIYAAGHDALEAYPAHTSVLRLSCMKDTLEDTDAALFPVQERTLDLWLSIYRQKVRHVPNASWMTDADGREMLCDGSGYFVHRAGSLLGIGRTGEDTIAFLASTQPGAGEEVVKALSHGVFSDRIFLEVASANEKAMALYQRLGFLPVQELSKWYKIL